VSWKAISKPAFAKITPVNPPIVNKKINPIANNIGVRKIICPPHIVATQLNTFTPVGIAIITVAAVKYRRLSISIPTVYI